MMSVLTMGSLFDGIGGFPLAAVRCGVKPLWASEIEPFPISVTRRRFPQMEHVLRPTLHPTLTSFLMPPSISAMRSAFFSVRSM